MKNINCRRIPNSLRKYRKARGLTQKDVARIMGLKNTSLISRWESGFCLPSGQNMFDLGLLYRRMVDDLFIQYRKSREQVILKAEKKFLVKKTQLQNNSLNQKDVFLT